MIKLTMTAGLDSIVLGTNEPELNELLEASRVYSEKRAIRLTWVIGTFVSFFLILILFAMFHRDLRWIFGFVITSMLTSVAISSYKAHRAKKTFFDLRNKWYLVAPLRGWKVPDEISGDWNKTNDE